MNTSTPQVPSISYLTCNKVGLHEDEKLNLVCLETSCLENLACCCACIEMEHKKHLIKPLKFVIEQARKSAAQFKPTNLNIDILLDLVGTQRKMSFELFDKHRQSIMASLSSIELSLQGYYNSIVEQIIIKNTDANILIEEAIDRASKAKTLEELKLTLKKLVVSIPGKSKQMAQVSEENLIYSLQSSGSHIRTLISGSMEQANKRLSQQQQSVNLMVNTLNIWNTCKYAFSQTFKHQDIKLINEETVKSITNAGYKFALMEPSIQSGLGSRKFAIKINESSTNWVAVGVCHKKIVQGKKFGFNFGSIGHGAYMVSANGGSWSHIRADQNNSIKAFKFGKGDVVQVQLIKELNKVVFSCGVQTYELPFEPIAQDELHPCALFYYVNDEVSYLPNYKP